MKNKQLNHRQIRCLSALRSGCDQLSQAQASSAAWHARTSNDTWVRLSLTGGDVWMMTKMGLIERVPDERKFTLPKKKIHLAASQKTPLHLRSIKIAA
jgi:hypothetical protein